MMNENELWEAIQQAVESGEETSTIDLKGRLYHFKKDVEKGEFIKDAVAISNTLDTQKARGYLVIGVLDSDQRKGIGCREYILGVRIPSWNRLEQRVNNLLREYVEPDLAVMCSRLVHPRIRKKLAIIVIPCWQCLNPFNPRPCIIKKDIGRIRRGQIFMRAGSDTYAALTTDIARLVGSGLRVRYQKEIEELKDQLSNEIKRRERDLEALKTEHSKEVEWLDERTDDLERDKEKLIQREEEWRELARATIRKAYRNLPEDSREKEVRQMLARFRKEDYFSEWIK